MFTFTHVDVAALILWLASWAGYPYLSKLLSHNRPNLLAYTHPYRRQWMRNALGRDLRIADATLVGNLMQTSTFFSSTTVIILGALLAFLGSIDEGLRVVSTFPLAQRQTSVHIEVKALIAIGVFVLALIRFTWALRQLNVVNILMGAMPNHAQREQDPVALADADKAAKLVELAGDNFSQGIRSYYYAVPVLLWLINPWLFGVTSVVMTLVIYLMDFHSSTVRALATPQ